MHKRPLLLVILLAALLPWLLQAYRVRQLDRCRSNALEISCALEMYASDCSLSVAPAATMGSHHETKTNKPGGTVCTVPLRVFLGSTLKSAQAAWAHPLMSRFILAEAWSPSRRLRSLQLDQT